MNSLPQATLVLWRMMPPPREAQSMNEYFNSGGKLFSAPKKFTLLTRIRGDSINNYDILTLRLLLSFIYIFIYIYIYIYGAPILDVSRSYTTTHHSR